MESWQDQGIVLKTRPHGESGAVVTLLTERHGRHAGYVPGGQSSKKRGVIEPGNLVSVRWSSRTGDDALGSFQIETERAYAATLMQDRLQLAALLSACALCDAALPEREGHPGLFHGFHALLEIMGNEDSFSIWGAAYVMWEISLLRELGFSLDLTRCVAGGSNDLQWVSPKSGGAVSKEMGEAYKDRLLPLPGFLKPVRSGGDDADVLKGLVLTGYFLEHWVFVHHKGMPEERTAFQSRFEKISPFQEKGESHTAIG